LTTLVGQYGSEALLDPTGHLLTSTAVTVLTVPGGVNAALYADLTGASGGTGSPFNPVTTTSAGNLTFFAPPGQYDLQVGGVTTARVIVTLTGASMGQVGGPAGPLNGSGQIPSGQIPSSGGGSTSGDLSGTLPGPLTVLKVNGQPVASTAPTTGQTLTWNGSAYSPATPPASSDIFNVKAAPYNAVGNGVADDTAAIAAANTAAHSIGGTVYFPPGVYKTSSTISVTSPKVNWQGQNSASVYIQPTNSGDCLRWQMSPFVADMQCGSIAGLTFDGTHAGAATVAIHYGDAMNGFLDDLHIVNFTGGTAIGIWMDNVTNYTEGIHWGQILVTNNTFGVVFNRTGSASTSFGYHRMEHLRLDCNSGQIGVVLQNGALFYNGVMKISGNFANGSTLMQINGIIGSGGTGIGNCLFGIQAETLSGSAVGIALNEYASMTGEGVVDLSSGTFVSTNDRLSTGHVGTFDLTGWIKMGTGITGALKVGSALATTASSGTATLPAQPAGFTIDYINGAPFKRPFYNP
jgi:Pectate lyase superfamily protein